ncbi:CAMK family protein kinase [Trichomonas vaginalis G3]|uniref:CAMK family protein kinase n=1 Tax=Trichomonas vaginalis (strain ATCC PRA-98 / G3) TaxID=412133 RepID=A2EK08_TRIV3|nr:protein serine/threonine kinase protein [Trichomonas vaginalis G3]EAY06992.1 CAMK family protein kinase [Trichomonas vaginalis G3]KAI5488828.1 protein serine/threonine kinase protein [Trichomonas vaginalis G3]|eukprot:XP_001319215.1 CAMK family protein kinase [Trichomonas vaginalis G3]
MYISDYELTPHKKEIYPECQIGEQYIGECKSTKQKFSILKINRFFISNSLLFLNLKVQIELLSSCFHPNIQKYIDCHYEGVFQYIILEYEENTFYSLFEKNDSLNRREIFGIFKQIVSALEYLHQNNIVHLDIRPESIFLTDNNELRLGNFYNAHKIEPDELITVPYGTLNFAAPETKTDKPYDGKAADVFACGILLLSMFIRKLAISGSTIEEIEQNFANGQIFIPSFINEDVRSLISSMIDFNPEKRIPIENVKLSQWYTSEISALI